MPIVGSDDTFSRVRPLFAGIVIAAILGQPQLAAQATDASIAGQARGPDGSPIADVAITLRNQSNGFTAGTRTNADGRFVFVQLPLGGPYLVSAQRIGYRRATRTAEALTLGARVTIDFQLEAAAAELTPLVVTGDSAAVAASRLGGSTLIGAAEMSAIPAAGRSFTDLASLAPAAGAEFSLAGQRPTSTDVEIDGLQARNMLRGGELGRGPYTVSMEAIREFEIVTNVYDVTVGRQGGGAVNAVTRFGTNDLAASVFAYHRDDALTAARDYTGRSRDARPFSLYQWGGSAGGPIVRDRLHYFVAFDRQNSNEPLAVADLRTPQDELEAQVSRDSVARFVDILQRRYGLPSSSPQIGVFSRTPVANTAFARLDWQLSPRHRLTLRNNYSDFDSPYNGVGDQRVTVFESRSSSHSHDDQLLASLRSTLGDAVQNELKLGFSLADRSLVPNTYIPRGFVRVRSRLPDGTIGDTRLQFGGNRLAPEISGERQLQLLNTTYWQRGKHLITVGFDNSLTYLKTFIPTDEGGLFEFDSLVALDSLRAARYTRQVPLAGQPRSRQYVLDAGLFAQTEWQVSRAVMATLGLRYDVTSFRTAAERNPLVEQRLGLRTDNTPTDWNNIQPRGQIVWDRGGGGRDIVRVGAGAFAAQPHYYLQANNIFFSGTHLADLTLTGAAAPRPNFPAYRADLSTVPGVPVGATPPAYVNLIGANFQTPTTWKASVSYRRRMTGWLTLDVSAFAAKTIHNYQYFDRNLRDTSAFRLDNEANRAVFVPASTITAAGRTAATNAFKNPEFTHVLELVSSGTARQRALVLEAALGWPGGKTFRATYTRNQARDNSTFNCCIARTASLFTPVTSDPRDLSGSYGPSDFDFRHKVVVAGEWPLGWGFVLGGRYVGSSGRPFSLVVNGDINGDDYNGNDLAFVFDPNNPATDSSVAAAMRRVLANPQSVARDCIRRSLGRISSRNCGAAPWTGRIDLRLSKVFHPRHGQSAELVVDVYNFANLLNSEWGGQYLLPQGISASNPISQQLALLNVVGFDQTTRRYRYTVNESVGVLRKRGDPYQIQLGVRYGI